MPERHSKRDRTSSPLWHKALERYREDLEENDIYQDVIKERTALNSMSRLGPKLKFVDDFSAIIALYFGADTKLTALVWGSIRLMLTLASSAGDTLRDILDMLEELSLTLPRFRTYEDTLPMDRSLETALLDVYTEVICFYARAIHFFRTHPHVLLRRGAWEGFRSDFGRTVRRIKRMASTVEGEADLARMKIDKVKYKEVLELMEGFKKSQIHDNEAIKCHHIPFELNPRFWGREKALRAIKEALSPKESIGSLKAFALYGMGGVGKTQIALQYANRNREQYNAILWVVADNTISMGQSFQDITILKVKNWLTEARFPWLLISDNADDLEVLRLAWPGNAHGSVLLTTRDFSATHSPAPAGFHVEPFDDATGSEVLLHLVGLDTKLPSNQEKARAITHALGGLPLALNQIGGFISQRKFPLQDFLPLYERHSAKIDSKKTGISDYEHTLSTVWEMSLSKLSSDPCKLLNLLVFFEPDAINESILTEGSKLLGEEFEFLHDEMDLGDAEEVLLRAALIDKRIKDAVLSIHRLVQAAVMRRLTEKDQSKYFDAVVRMLSWGFPDTWSEDIGHQFQAWTKCEKCLPHVDSLVKQAKRYKIRSQNDQLCGELLLRCSWYLYEREWYDVARNLVNVALETFKDKTTLAFASATDLSGLIDLDMNHPATALLPFNTALQIRESILGPDDPLIASSLNNIALAYTEMAEMDRAYAIHQKAIDIRLRTQSDRIGNSYSNMSSLLLRMGKPNEAEEMLKKCPSLKDFTDETFLQTGNPRFSGDMVLLSRIRLGQGCLDDAMRLASKALTFRHKLLGNRLKTCDSLYDVADLLNRQGKVSSAIELLTQLVAISETLNEGEGQLARANYKLAVLYDQKGMGPESESCKARSLKLREKLRPEAENAPYEEREFMKLCLWMLW